MIKLLGIIFAFILISNVAYGKTVEIEMLNIDAQGRKMIYSQEN
tara:strand:- start:627 stop:758 length:132 start_codon:yes stop_codon:yes gene_type:complete